MEAEGWGWSDGTSPSCRRQLIRNRPLLQQRPRIPLMGFHPDLILKRAVMSFKMSVLLRKRKTVELDMMTKGMEQD